jgi:hypothetical protein
VRVAPQANTAQLAATCAALRAQREAREANLTPQRPGARLWAWARRRPHALAPLALPLLLLYP